MILVSTLGFSQTTYLRITGVKDGDTVVGIDSLKVQHTLRLSDIDCPEKRQPFGYRAKQFTSDAIFSKWVKVTLKGKDKYGRQIASVYYGENYAQYLSKNLVVAGLAWVYREYCKDGELLELEDRARGEKVGLWIDTNPIKPSIYRNSKTKQ